MLDGLERAQVSGTDSVFSKLNCSRFKRAERFCAKCETSCSGSERLSRLLRCISKYELLLLRILYSYLLSFQWASIGRNSLADDIVSFIAAHVDSMGMSSCPPLYFLLLILVQDSTRMSLFVSCLRIKSERLEEKRKKDLRALQKKLLGSVVFSQSECGGCREGAA